MQFCSQDLSDCPAIMKCPFAHACPGDTEKSCAGDALQVRNNVFLFQLIMMLGIGPLLRG
jgi:hypothetical protein